MKLNLGCGDLLLDGFENVDIVPGYDVLVADLRLRWPWPDGSIDEIQAMHIFEHLPDKIFTMNEAWRVLKPGGMLGIALPTTEGPGAWQDPTHVSYWNRRSFLYYTHGDLYHERYAERYGIEASFEVAMEAVQETVDGPILFILLRAYKG